MTRTSNARSLGATALAGLLAAPLFAVLAATPAYADSTGEILGGRERIKVSVTAAGGAPDRCVYTLQNEAAFLVTVPAWETESRVFEASPGEKNVSIECESGLEIDKKVTVGQTDLLLDLVDLGLTAAGSSNLTTDPTKG